jgi:hypothetical protein
MTTANFGAGTVIPALAVGTAQAIARKDDPNHDVRVYHSAPRLPFCPAILMPAYECTATIGAVVAGARAYDLPILVVDDGSHDDTAAVARAAGADVVRHPVNRGKGAALVTGMRALAGRGHTHALTMDADGQHLASEIPILLAQANDLQRAIVIGVRRIGDQAVAGIKLFGNRFANLAVSAAAGVSVPDTQSGFRVYPLAAVLHLPVRGQRFEYESTVLIVAAYASIPIRSVPVGVYYPPIAERRSHYRHVGDTLRIVRAVAPLLARRALLCLVQIQLCLRPRRQSIAVAAMSQTNTTGRMARTTSSGGTWTRDTKASAPIKKSS